MGRVPARGTVPDWWHQATRALARRDPVMRGVIRASQGMALKSRGNAFQCLARSIVGQQISVKAAHAVWLRLEERLGRVSPRQVSASDLTELRGVGLSARKAEYIMELAAWFASRAGRRVHWPELTDAEVISVLTERRGIGRWTAEMFLIFCLLRPDVFPVDDLGLLRALSELYGSEKGKRSAAEQFGEQWEPWRSCATWHLWRHLDPVPVAY
ncbi:MAG: hypothetical protein OXF33_15300 [Rhodospirillales bacterium]|nr:hypothetical protein [Rhodospirillales bacterium]